VLLKGLWLGLFSTAAEVGGTRGRRSAMMRRGDGAGGTSTAARALACGVFATSLLALTRMRTRAISDRVASVPPVAEKRPVVVKFGKVEGENRGANPMDPPREIVDPYFWLRDDKRENHGVLELLRHENAYCDVKTRHLKSLTQRLYDNFLSHIKETDESVPYPYGAFFYYFKTKKGSSYRIYYRAKSKEEIGTSAEELLLDMNKIAKGKKHCDLGTLAPSPDHTMMGYSLDESGYETYKATFKDLKTGKLLDDKLPDMTGSIKWGRDNKTVFYAVHDGAHRPFKLYKHVMGTDPSDDILLNQEDDEEFWMSFGKTLSGRFLVCHCGTSESSEVRVLDLEDENQTELRLIHPRTDGLRYEIDHRGDFFYIVTNADGSKNQKLMYVPITNPSKENWKDLIPYDAAINIESITVFKDFMVVEGREKGFTALWLLDPENPDQGLKKIEGFPDSISTMGTGVNLVFDTNEVRVVYESMVTPPTTYDINMETQEMKLVHRKPVPNYDPSLYHCERLEAKGHDGTMIPMSMVYKKGNSSESPKSKRKPGPLLLYGYGSYGICNDPDFTPNFITLLDRGVCVVLAHIRGGGEMGRPWYEDEGKFLQKKNTFYDFISCAEHLTEEKYTNSYLLAITGRSAGGLLMGAVLNMAPHLFKCCVAGVPFVDVMCTMADASIPLTTGEWTEWGNPSEEKYFEYMLSYSPIDNVTEQDYPSILITSGLWDSRVAYWEPAKWVARLREKKTDNNPLLLKTDLSSGHFSASDRYKYLRERAFEYAFMLDQLGIHH